MMTKGNLFMSIKGNFRCQFVYSLYGVLAKLYCARMSHGMAQFVLKIPDLSILMEPTLLLEKGPLCSKSELLVGRCTKAH